MGTAPTNSTFTEMNLVLSPEELVALTGYKYPYKSTAYVRFCYNIALTYSDNLTLT